MPKARVCWARPARKWAALGIAVTALLAGRTQADDGVIEINAARAAAGGVTPGDGAGFPVTLSLAGSYRLTGNLTSSNPNHDFIVITAPHVTLDLGGHTIEGPTRCFTFPCTNTGSGRAIAAVVDDVRVSNGIVRGMGGFGIELVGNGCQIEDLFVLESGSNGIQAYCTGQILRTVSRRNGANGIHLLFGIVAESQAHNNASSGIYITGGALIARNSSIANGIWGIRSEGTSALVGNAVIGNSSSAFSLNSGTGYGQNTISGNGAPQVGGGVQMGGNVCNAAAC